MKDCKIKGDLRSKNFGDHLTNILLCNYCYLADSKRGEDKQVVSDEDISPCEDVRCEVCNKTFDEEQKEYPH